MNPSHLIARIKEAFGGDNLAICTPSPEQHFPMSIFRVTMVNGDPVVDQDNHVVTCHSYKELEAFYFTVSAINQKGKTVWRYE